MTPLDAFILGLVQGLTEFLPVSSSGHLILARDLLGLDGSGLLFDASLHVATLAAVCIYFRHEIGQLIAGAFKFIFRKPMSDIERGLLMAVAWGSVPAFVFAYFLHSPIDTYARSGLVVAGGLILGSAIMWWAERETRYEVQGTNENSSLVHRALSSRIGFRIGLFQALALIPGVSRSGATISGGLLNNLSRDQATRFAFVLAFPIMLAAGGMSLLELLTSAGGESVATSTLIAGLATALISGLAAIHFLVRYLKTHTLSVFIWYRLALACIILLAYSF